MYIGHGRGGREYEDVGVRSLAKHTRCADETGVRAEGQGMRWKPYRDVGVVRCRYEAVNLLRRSSTCSGGGGWYDVGMVAGAGCLLV